MKPYRSIATVAATLAAGLALFAATAAPALAAGSRVHGKITDSSGAPIPDALVVVTNPTVASFKREAKANKKGDYSVVFVDVAHVYTFTIQKEGYQSYEAKVKPNLTEPQQKDFKLLTIQEAVAAQGSAPAGGSGGTPAKQDPNTVLFNEAVELSKTDKAAAIAKFEQVVTAKPETYQAWANMTKLSFEMKNWDKTIEYGEKALSYNSELPGVVSAVHAGYKAKGNKEKEAEYSAKLREMRPPSAAELFNEAAQLLNKGQDKDAIPLLEQAIAADATFAEAYFELGMAQVRSGDSGAKGNFNKYLELAPTGKNAGAAKEALKYTK